MVTSLFKVSVVFASLCCRAEARLGVGTIALTQDNFRDFVGRNDKVLVDFYDPNDDGWQKGQADLEAAVRILKDNGYKVPVAKVDVRKDEALAKRFVPQGRQYPQLLWFRHGEATQYHRSLRTAKAIVDFVLALDRDPMVLVKSEEEARDYVPAVFAHVNRGSQMFKALEVIAAKHMDTVAFTFVDSPGDSVAWLGNNTAPEWFQSAATEALALEKWVRTKLVKSEPIPEDPELLVDAGSKVVVGHTFEETVLQKDKDVILQVYAPWCGFCKKFAPVWDRFATELADVEHLLVAKMDGSRNGSPLPEDFEWDRYPMVFFVPAGKKKPIVYEGNRTFEHLVEFVNEHSSKPFEKRQASRLEEAVVDL